jgi:AcrR family transcriptional regulator
MPLRTDAARNRKAIVDTARVVFAEQGLDVALDEIAQRAGIGNATLYRRFPTRADLIAAVFAEQMAEYAAAVEAALADPDPWEGVRYYVEAITAMQAKDRGLGDLVTMDISGAGEIEQLRGRAFKGMVALIRRATAAGVVRTEFSPEDVLILLMANAGLVERAHASAETASARLVHLLLDGMRAEAATDGPRPPSPRRMHQAMRENSARLGLCSPNHSPTETTKET